MPAFYSLYSLDFLLLVVCAGVWYKAGEIENAPRMLWPFLSVVIFLATWQWLHWGVPGHLLGQFLLLATITLVRVLADRRQSSK